MDKIIKTIEDWLSNADRNYAQGLTLFEACATETQKKEYLPFLRDADPEAQTQFSLPMSILTNRLADIKQMMQVSPQSFKEIKLMLKKEKEPASDQLKEKQAQIDQCNAVIGELKEEIEASGDQNDELMAQLEEKETELEALRQELEELEKKKGLQIISLKDLPKKLQKAYERNQEITPLMASVHAEIANEATPEEKRKELVELLCELDDERRANWDKIDEWAEGKNTHVETEQKPAYDTDPILAGLQMARRIERLKENIKRSAESAEKGKSELIRTNAAKRVAAYQAELDELVKLTDKADNDPAGVE